MLGSTAVGTLSLVCSKNGPLILYAVVVLIVFFEKKLKPNRP